jgi:plastocyanin
MSPENAWKVQKWAWVAFAAFFVASCGLNGPAHREPPKGADAFVDMGFMIFEPAAITIHRGETVEWRNTAFIAHTVTDEPAKTRHPELAGLPQGGQPFDSGKIKAGNIYKHTFTAPGVYKYYCGIHADHGMAGTVTVLP